jgi:phosphonate degradation associated HDIG domain protein
MDAITRDGPVVGQRRGLAFSAWCIAGAFGTYFCMYGFRKPFTAASYANVTFSGVGYKAVLVTAQVLGYTLSKLLGVRVISEVRPHQRVFLLLTLIAIAEVALLLFAVTPAPFNCLWLFVNGLPLGIVFGLVLGFLEGRQQTEALAAGLCVSFIVAGGVTKSVGSYLLHWGTTEHWMPFVAGLLFAPPLLLFVWMLSVIPPPDPADVAARSERTPMSSRQRSALFRRYALGLTLLVVAYLLVTILRSLRDDFSPEIWRGLQGTVAPSVFTWSEMAVGACVLVLTGSAVLVRDHQRAFFAALALGVGGLVLVAAALLGLHAGVLSPFPFMVLNGLGLYLPYLVVQTTVFERLVAMTRHRGNIGYLIYLADAAGYLGYVVLLLAVNAFGLVANMLSFFLAASWIIATACIILFGPCWYYFAMHPATRRSSVPSGAQDRNDGGGAMPVIDQIFALFKERGGGAHFGEPVTQMEHALQCAHLAETSGASKELIAAALLHDVGHLLHGLGENIADYGTDARHEEGGATWLERRFPPAVVMPIRLHVAAKRYLCSVEPEYQAGLSAASQVSLRLQGGPLTPEERMSFEQGPWSQSAVAVRRWDDAAKVPGLEVPGLEHYRRCLEVALLQGEQTWV